MLIQSMLFIDRIVEYFFFIAFILINLLYFRAEKSPESKEQFLRQLENIDVSVKQTLDRVSVADSFFLTLGLVNITSMIIFCRWKIKEIKSKVSSLI